jgi:large subunit ribosomal protein L21
MHAVIKTGGKQYRVQSGDEFNVEKLNDTDVGADITFDEILSVGDGDDLAVGTPIVDGATVTAQIVEHGRGKKIIVFKKKRRKKYRKKKGHRQHYTRIRITDVSAG